MPIYEYRRPDGTTFEVLQKITEDALTHDPETGEPVERVLHPVAIHFKGSGFHNTDYGTRKRNKERESSKKESAASSDSASSSASSTSDSKSTTTKSSSKSESKPASSS